MRHTTHLVLVGLISIFAFACAPDVVLEENGTGVAPDGYATVDGIYRVHVYETEDTCLPITDENRIDRNSWLYVTVQEEREDGSYLVDLSLADLLWYEVEVAPDGTFEGVYDNYGMSYHYATGTLAPDGVVFDIQLDMMSWYEPGEVDCSIFYEVEGFPLFVREEPPADFYREAVEEDPDLNPFDN